MRKIISICFIIVLSSCASNNPSLLTATDIVVLKQVEDTPNITVLRGNSRFSNDVIRQAIINSMNNANIFDGSIRNLEITMTLQSVKEPILGLDVTSVVRANWKVVDQTTGNELFNENIIGSHTAAFFEHLIAAKRMKIANDNAIKENIKQGLVSIAKQIGK